MRKISIILCFLCCTGCQISREPMVCRVVDAADRQPIRGAKVWMQPWAPIHPFWPAGDKGVTNDNGEATLSLPNGFWFYFSGAEADGYSRVKDVEGLPQPPAGTWAVFYMKRDAGVAAR
jgi:hypothetical protein